MILVLLIFWVRFFMLPKKFNLVLVLFRDVSETYDSLKKYY